MFFHLKPILLSLALLVGYELAAYRYDIAPWILGFVLLSVVVGTYKIVGKWSMSLFPIIYFAGSSALLFFVSGGAFRQAYIFVAVLSYYLILLSIYRLSSYHKDETARRISYIMSLATVFIWCASLYAVYLNRNIGFWMISLIIYAVVWGVTHQLLKTAVLKDGLNYHLYSFTVSYCMMIIGWGVFFLPFGYLTLASLMLAVYFIITNYVIAALKEDFSPVSFAFDVVIFLVSVVFVVTSARWHLLK